MEERNDSPRSLVVPGEIVTGPPVNINLRKFILLDGGIMAMFARDPFEGAENNEQKIKFFARDKMIHASFGDHYCISLIHQELIEVFFQSNSFYVGVDSAIADGMVAIVTQHYELTHEILDDIRVAYEEQRLGKIESHISK